MRGQYNNPLTIVNYNYIPENYLYCLSTYVAIYDRRSIWKICNWSYGRIPPTQNVTSFYAKNVC